MSPTETPGALKTFSQPAAIMKPQARMADAS
jgi:hypothetical protein